MDVAEVPRFSRPLQVVLFQMPFVDMHVDDLKAHQDVFVPFGDLLSEEDSDFCFGGIEKSPREW